MHLPEPNTADWYVAPPIKPRDRSGNPRCHDCRDRGMFHPAHPWAPCTVTPIGGEPCGCTSGVKAPPPEL